jgi:hypothetical protein
MKSAKIISLLVVVAAVPTAFAASASATTVTTFGSNTTFTDLDSEGHVVIDNPIATISCASSATTNIETHGKGVTAAGFILGLSFTGCTNSWHVTVLTGGSIEFHAIGEGNATITSSEATIEATRFGVTCRYATFKTHLGTLTGSVLTGEIGGVEIYDRATLHLQAALEFHSGSFLCGSGATNWTGSYEVTDGPLIVDP